MEYFSIFENHEVKAFVFEFHRFTENLLEIDLSGKVSSANADSVIFKLACNVHVWAYFEKKNSQFLTN